jgi:alpha-glucosidase
MLETMTKTTHRRWAEGAIVYQVYPRSFYDSNADGIGDIPGVTLKLDYLQELGINAIWLSPFFPSPMADFGYDVADYCDVDPIFGNLQDMDELIAKAHSKDIRIIVDLVPNHTSDEHDWFHKSRQSREGPYADWYIWLDAKGKDKQGNPLPPNNWRNVITGESAWEWEPSRQQFYLHSFHVKQPDLNWANPVVREAIKDAMRFWLDRGVDGFRVDAVPWLAQDPEFRDDKKNPDYVPGKWHPYSALVHTNSTAWPAVHAHLGEMATVLKEKKYQGSARFMITEGYPQTPDSITEYLAYYQGMDPEVAAPFNFEGLSLPWKAKPWHEFLQQFHTALDEFNPLCIPSYAFGNHDQHRLVTRLGEPAARSAAVLLLTLPGMSFIYNGDELGMKNGDIPPSMVQDPGAVDGDGGRDPERTPLQWTPAKNAGFTTASTPWLPVADDYPTHNVETELNDPTSFLSLYRSLTKLRNDSNALRYGSIQLLDTGNTSVLGYTRSQDDETYVVLVNFSTSPQELPYPAGVTVDDWVLSSQRTSQEDDAQSALVLAANEAAVYTAK